MGFFSLFSSHEIAGLFITLAGQSVLISITGLILIKLFNKKTAPIRSLLCTATIIALGLLIVIFISARLSDISWQNEPTPVVVQEKISNVISVPNQYEPLPEKAESQVPLQSYSTFNNDMAYSTPTLEHSPYSISLSSTVITLINISGFIWIIGVLFQLSRLVYGLIIVKKFKGSLEAIKDVSFNNMLSNIAATLFRKGRLVPRLYHSSLIESPMAIGFIHPAIIIPEKLLNTINENELKSILLHEMAHIYHYDQVTGIIKRFIIAFYWWNPFVYIINHEHEQAREEVSDNYVLNELSPGDYSRCLMNLAEKVSLISNIPFASGMAGRGFNLIKRVEQILSKKRSNAMDTRFSYKTIVFVCFVVLTFGIAAINAKVQTDEPTVAVNEAQLSEAATNLVPEQKVDSATTEEKIKDPVAKISPVKELPERDQIASVAPNEIPAKKKIPEAIIAASDLTKSETETGKQTDQEASPSETLHKTDSNNKIEDNYAAEQKNPEDKDTTPIATPGTETMSEEPEHEDVNTLLIKGDEYYQNGKYEEAISILSKAIELNPANALLYYARGNTYIKAELFDKAISDFSKAIEINPGYTYAYTQRGFAYSLNGMNYERIISDYSKAIELDPNYTWAYIERANIYYIHGLYNKAYSDYKKATKLDKEAAIPKIMLKKIRSDLAPYVNNYLNSYFEKFKYERSSKEIEARNQELLNQIEAKARLLKY